MILIAKTTTLGLKTQDIGRNWKKLRVFSGHNV